MRSSYLGVFLFACALPAQSDLDSWLDRQLGDLVEVYKHFHQHPELSFREKKTSKKLADLLEKVGATVTRGFGGHGVVAIMENGVGPTVMVRGDMDGLPVAEKTGLPYRSKIYTENEKGQAAGIMHACGHDIHITNLIGTARYLADHKDLWKGRVMLIGQPAEERSGGASAMLKAGLFTKFKKPDYALALHVSNDAVTGTIGFGKGPVMANVDSVDITMYGLGGHGAKPHLTIDPVIQAAQLILQLQTIVSREIAASDPSVITVGSIHGGTKHNIISDTCHLQITVRSYSDAVRAHLKAAIIRKANAVAAGAGAEQPTVTYSEGTPSLINDAALVDRGVKAMRAILGDSNVMPMNPVMTAEDFGRFGRAGVPIFMFRLGTISPARMASYRASGKPIPSLHSSHYYPDPRESLATGIKAMAAVLLELLPAK
jgi:amidohydrolase